MQEGKVRNIEARLGGQPTYQLFSEDAAAGDGAPVKGLSGGPVFVDGALVTGPVMINAGVHDVDVRFAVAGFGDLPLALEAASGGNPPEPIDEEAVTHDQSALAPVINTAFPQTGDDGGGNVVSISGLGFFLPNEVVVNWGGQTLSGPDLTVTPSSIELTTPPGTGTVTVKTSGFDCPMKRQSPAW